MSLTPEYLNVDFSTLVDRLKDELKDSSVFRDYQYEGSNIAIILELMAYIGELTTFYVNKLAKNGYFDTVEIYENAHRLATWLGYYPKGHRSAKATANITVTPSGGNVAIGDTITVPAWKQITTTETYDNESIIFSTTTSNNFTVDVTPYTFNLDVRQGIVRTYSDYTGDDLIDNELILNLEDYAYDDDLEDSTPTILLTVNDVEWERVSDFYDNLSGLYTENNVYRFEYDKYKRYKIVFSSSRNVPSTDDEIEIKLLETFGSNGSVGASTITTPETQFLYNSTQNAWVDNSSLTVTNSAASYGADDPETIDVIKDLAPRTLHTQFRNVTANDYETYLESRSDVDAASVWGEQELAPSGSVQEFNKVHITVIPDEFTSNTIATSATSAGFEVPYQWSTDYQNTLSEYLEPRKMLCTYEYYELPDLVYFYYDIGLKVKRTYAFADVVEDVKDKLEYYFGSTMRSFNETIKFTDIINFIIDTSEVSSTNNFTQVKGIDNMIIRDINCSHTLYEPNSSNNYPQYTVAASTYTGDNKVRNITVGYDQFPNVKISLCNFTEES